MKETSILLPLLESVIGKGIPKSKGNYAFVCPFHTSNPPGKKNFEINLDTNEKNENQWHCWGCESKGKTIKSLFKKLKVNDDKYNDLSLLIRPGSKRETIVYEQLELPKEFISLNDITKLSKIDQLEARHAIQYLKNRHITKNDILKYNIGFCNEGIYQHRIIIPSYNNKAQLNWFEARTYKEDTFPKYKKPNIPRETVIGFELFINWDAPIMIVEGVMDALTIKRNVIPLFGKIINNKLMEKLVNSNVDKIYICLDKDAIKFSIKYAEQLLNLGKKVYLVEIDGKDINEIGYTKFLNILEKVQPLNFSKLMQLKLNLI